jgi:Fe-S-cluster-containing dehydrogenase component
MKKGFIFDQTLCVNCKACSAACILENNFKIRPRSVITYNSGISVILPVEHISIACNHCEIPVCLNGCPVSAYYRDQVTDAVILDESKCIGCKYCTWNCPYDAPKLDISEQIVGKCHLCYSRLEDGLSPACSSSCPTGALKFDYIEDYDNTFKPEWFHGEWLKPSIRFKKELASVPLKIVPGSLFRSEIKDPPIADKSVSLEWSLLIFSFLIMLSVSIISSTVISGTLPDKILFLVVSIIPGLISFFHLGKIFRAWRVLANIRTSPLSREIALYLIYLSISSYAVVSEMPWLLVCSSAIGLLLLFTIDSVYFYAVKKIRIYFHSGQTLLSALLLISILSGNINPFAFIALIKIVLSVYAGFNKIEEGIIPVIRILRIGLLIAGGIGYVSGLSYHVDTLIIIIIVAEFLDRLLFYIDFEPDSINKLMDKHIKDILYEKR